MSYWDENIAILKERYPQLARRVLENPVAAQLKTVKAQDGLCAYGFMKEGNVFQPITNPGNPGEKINAKLDEWRTEILNFTRPILVIGFNPGIEVLMLFENRENQSGNYCKQPLWICVDSVFTLYGFLRTYDARKLLSSERVELFWHEEMKTRVEWLAQHPEFSYLFTLFSLSSQAIQDRVLAPLVKLAQKRQIQLDRYLEENEAYYQGIPDEQLARIIRGQGERAPRLLVPSCSWSTVIQYSIRDTCDALERRGWETRILNSPAMLTPHYVAEAIHEFKPDVFLYVDHLRTEVSELIPRNLMLMTWVQDTLPYINCEETATAWNEQTAGRNRDVIFGYVKQLEPYGYPKDRLYPLSMIVDTGIFRPKELTEDEMEQYGCDVCFASNRGLPTQRVLDEHLVEVFEPYGISKEQLQQWHDQLWEHYRSGETLVNYQQLIDFLKLDGMPDDNWVQLLFWRVNDIIYRHSVVGWIHEYAQTHPGFRLRLYGQGWQEHPCFGQYACGEITHGRDLATAYQAARYCLHLNTLEGMHQRIPEIVAAGGHMITRMQQKKNLDPEVLTQVYRKLFLAKDQPLTGDEIKVLHQDFFGCLYGLVKENPECPLQELKQKTIELFDLRKKGTILSMLDAWEPHVFTDRESLLRLLDYKNKSSLCESSLEQTRRMLQTHTDDMLVILRDTLPLKEAVEQINSLKTPYPDCFALLECLYALQTGDVESITKAFTLLQHPFFAIRHLVVDCLGRNKRYADMHYVLNDGNEVMQYASAGQLLTYAFYSVKVGQRLQAERYVQKAYSKDDALVDGYVRLAWADYQQNGRITDEMSVWFKKDKELGRLSPAGMLKHILIYSDQYTDVETIERITHLYFLNDHLRDGFSQYAWIKYVKGSRQALEKTLPFFRRDAAEQRLTPPYCLKFARVLIACDQFNEAEDFIKKAYSEDENLQDGYAQCGIQRWYVQEYVPERAVSEIEKDKRCGRLSPLNEFYYAAFLSMTGNIEKAGRTVDELLERRGNTCRFGIYTWIAWAYYSQRFRLSEESFDWLKWVNRDRKDDRLDMQMELVVPAFYMLAGQTEQAEEMMRLMYAKANTSDVFGGYTLLGACDYLINKNIQKACVLLKNERLESWRPAYLKLIHAAFLNACRKSPEKVIQCIGEAAEESKLSWSMGVSWLKRNGYTVDEVDELMSDELHYKFNGGLKK